MEFSGFPCALGDHPLVDPVYATDPKLVAFIRKRFRHFRVDDEICRKCLRTVTYMYKLKKSRASNLARSRQMPSVSSASDTISPNTSSILETSASPNTSSILQASASPNTSSILTQHMSALSSQSSDEFQPSPNATNGTRLPHVQPIIRRNVLVRLNDDVMNAYIAGIIGG